MSFARESSKKGTDFPRIEMEPWTTTPCIFLLRKSQKVCSQLATGDPKNVFAQGHKIVRCEGSRFAKRILIGSISGQTVRPTDLGLVEMGERAARAEIIARSRPRI